MSELHCDDVERLRSALSWMGYATPEGLEACCARQDDLVRDLIRAVLAQKKTIMDGKFVDCACGDRYPAISYGAGFIDAAGHCPNCDASLPAAEDAQGWISVKERLPKEHSGKVLVTNNIKARDAFGHMSHVWLVDLLLHDRAANEFMAYTEGWQQIHGITHWKYPFAAPAMSQDSKGEV